MKETSPVFCSYFISFVDFVWQMFFFLFLSFDRFHHHHECELPNWMLMQFLSAFQFFQHFYISSLVFLGERHRATLLKISVFIMRLS